jgi:hypothetical protein
MIDLKTTVLGVPDVSGQGLKAGLILAFYDTNLGCRNIASYVFYGVGFRLRHLVPQHL